MKILSSLVVLIPLVFGLAAGATVVPAKMTKAVDILLTAAVGLILFTMGVSLGASPTLLDDLRQAGMQAFALTAAAMVCSVAVVYLLARLFLKEDGQ